VSPPVIDDPATDNTRARQYATAPLTAAWLQMVIDASPAGSEAVSLIRKTMVTPLIRERVKTAADLRFMQPRRQR
jgi:hypothetical protein